MGFQSGRIVGFRLALPGAGVARVVDIGEDRRYCCAYHAERGLPDLRRAQPFGTIHSSFGIYEKLSI